MMHKWISITSDKEAERLMSLFGGFHDSCIREARVRTKHFVSSNLAMSTDSGLDTSIKFVVQRQLRNPSCIELQFDQVTRFNLVPTPENYSSVIYYASLMVKLSEITWVLNPDDSGLSENDASEDTWVTAKVLKYRVADELLGPHDEEIY